MFSSCHNNNNFSAVLVPQTSFHVLLQVVCISQTKDGPAKMSGPPCTTQFAVLKNSTFSCSLTVQFHTRSLPPLSPRRPPAASWTTGSLSEPPLGPLPAVPTVVHWSGTPRHWSARLADRHGRWPLPPASRQLTPRTSRGGPKGPKE